MPPPGRRCGRPPWPPTDETTRERDGFPGVGPGKGRAAEAAGIAPERLANTADARAGDGTCLHIVIDQKTKVLILSPEATSSRVYASRLEEE